MKSLRNGLIGLSALVLTALTPTEGKSMGVQWGAPGVGSGGSSIQALTVQNNNPGTTYSTFTINSLQGLLNLIYTSNPLNQTTYGSMGAMAQANVSVNISSDEGNVNNGWGYTINSNGSITFAQTGGPEDDSFDYNGVFVANVYIAPGVLGTMDPSTFTLTQNTQGLTDVAINSNGTPYTFTPATVVVPEPTALALLALGTAGLLLRRKNPNSEYKCVKPTEKDMGMNPYI